MKKGDIVVITVARPSGVPKGKSFAGSIGVISKVYENGDCLVNTFDSHTTGFVFAQNELRLAKDNECREAIRRALA